MKSDLSRMRHFLEQLSALLSEPLESVRDRERTTLDRALEAADRRIVLFGAGSTGRRALTCLQSIGVEPLAFTDNNRHLWETRIDGVSVLSPAEAASAHGDDSLFAVTVWNAHHRYRETSEQLRSLGVRSLMPVNPVFWRFPEVFLPFFSQDLSHKVFAQREAVLRAAELWDDDQSRAEFLAHIQWRALGDPSSLAQVTDHQSYFDLRLYSLTPDEIFVDCGAYDGDTLASYLRHQTSPGGCVHLVEANPLQWPVLKAQIARLDARSPAVVLHQCAVGASRGLLRFDSLAATGAKISETGDASVMAVTLDELLAGTRPSFLKMDIEGAEYDALRGSRRLIQQNRPILSICVYHTQEDIWRIPLLVNSLVANYRYYLRTYEGDGWQCVLYAIPGERASKLRCS